MTRAISAITCLATWTPPDDGSDLPRLKLGCPDAGHLGACFALNSNLGGFRCWKLLAQKTADVRYPETFMSVTPQPSA